MGKLKIRHEKKLLGGVGTGLAEWLETSEWIIRGVGLVYFLIAFKWYGWIGAIAIWVATYIVFWFILRGINHEGTASNTVKKRRK